MILKTFRFQKEFFSSLWEQSLNTKHVIPNEAQRNEESHIILILSRFATAKLLRMSYTERNSLI